MSAVICVHFFHTLPCFKPSTNDSSENRNYTSQKWHPVHKPADICHLCWLSFIHNSNFAFHCGIFLALCSILLSHSLIFMMPFFLMHFPVSFIVSSAPFEFSSFCEKLNSLPLTKERFFLSLVLSWLHCRKNAGIFSQVYLFFTMFYPGKHPVFGWLFLSAVQSCFGCAHLWAFVICCQCQDTHLQSDCCRVCVTYCQWAWSHQLISSYLNEHPSPIPLSVFIPK